MYTDLFTPESLAELKTAFVTQFPMALWETFYVTVLSTALAVVLGLPSWGQSPHSGSCRTCGW